MVDWVVEGRKARGESWDFLAWRGRNEVWDVYRDSQGLEKKRLLVRDAVVLQGRGIQARMDGMGVLGTLILRGPLFESLGTCFIDEFKALPRIGARNWGGADEAAPLVGWEKWRSVRIEREVVNGVLWTACRVRGCIVVKFSAQEVQGAREWLGAMLREEGSVGREFGPGGLMFVR